MRVPRSRWQLDTANCRTARIADVDRFRQRAKGGEIAAGIDETMGSIVLVKDSDRLINGETFGDAAKIDLHARAMEANVISRQQDDGVARCGLGKAAFDI
jgi:hypothetical protein